MVDYIRHIINLFEKKGFTEEQIESAVRKFEEVGEEGTMNYLNKERLIDEKEASELVKGIKKELSIIKRESAIRGLIYIFVFITIGVLTWKAHGYWIGIIFFILTGVKIVAALRYFITGK